MRGRESGTVPARLARGRQEFEAWRRGREPGTRIPERLWTRAVKLAVAYGLHRTASVLRLDYYSLKRRVEAVQSTTDSAAPVFVELPSPPPFSPPGECLIEFEDSAGATMRVHLKGYDAPDLVALGRSFWNGE